MNGDMERRIANNLNLSVALENCDALVDLAHRHRGVVDFACSSGSAMPSHVLQAIGADGASTIRLTVGRFNTEEEIDHAIAHLRAKLEECQARRPYLVTRTRLHERAARCEQQRPSSRCIDTGRMTLAAWLRQRHSRG